MVDVCDAALRALVHIASIPGEVKCNRRKCARLTARLASLESPLLRLKTAGRNQSFSDGQSATLSSVLALCEESLAFMRQFTARNWVRKAMHRARDIGEFDELNQRLCACVNDLQIEVAVDLLEAQEQDREDEQQDFADMEDALQRLSHGMSEVKEGVKDIEVRSQDHHADVMAALQSLRVNRRPAAAATKTHTEIPFSELEMQVRIGSGSFGEVWSGLWYSTPVAVKRITAPVLDRAAVYNLREEVALHETLRFPFIVQLIGACTQRPNLCLVLELAPHGNLFELLHSCTVEAVDPTTKETVDRPQPLDLSTKAAMLFDVCRGMEFLHSKSVAHRDLKSLNLLLFDGHRVKLCDFGLSRVKSDSASITTSSAGTTAWLAPEILCGEDSDDDDDDAEAGRKGGGEFDPQFAGDMFSFGVVVYEFMSRRIPYRGKKDGTIINYVLKGRRLALADDAEARHGPLEALMNDAWAHEPSDRPTFSEASRRIAAIVEDFGGDMRTGQRKACDALPLERQSSRGAALPSPTPFPAQTMLQRQRSTEVALRDWLDGLGLAAFADGLAQMGVTCLADCSFVELDDLVGDGVAMTVIQARRFIRSRDNSSAPGHQAPPPPPSKTGGLTTSKQLVHTGPELKKGFLPEMAPFDPRHLARVRNRRFDRKEQAWVKRDTPLSDDELDCWQEQVKWLKCPITGANWIDAKTILGVGIYHAPRALSDAELQRERDWEEANAQQNRHQRQQEELEEKADDGASTEKAEDAWWGNFFVYPSVDPPPALPPPAPGSTPGDSELATLGHTELMIGPAFDVSAYNLGINGGEIADPSGGVATLTVKSKSARGVLHNDTQWNALNFQYWISRDGGDNFIKKLCTNRLSFFIEEFHGQRVFPNNIRSQLSLLLWRNKNMLTLANGNTDQTLLALAIRKTLPRLLLCAVMEVYNGRSDTKNNKLCSEDYIDFAVRTYLLVHQVSIKLVVQYDLTRGILVESVLRWMMAPSSERAVKEWPDLLELLVGASLVGMPWQLLREPFMRMLFSQIAQSAPVTNWHPRDRSRRLKHIFNHNASLLRRFLLVFSFFATGRSVGDLDRAYARCAGSLPRSERDAMKERVGEVMSVEDLPSVWNYVGMEFGDSDPHDVEEHVDALLRFCWETTNGRAGCGWRKSDLPSEEKGDDDEDRLVISERRLRSLGDVLDASTAFSNAALDAARAEATERAKHVGYPNLNRRGGLDRLRCNYPECGRRFSCRDHLFRHLNRMIGPSRMITGYHETHFELRRRGLTDAQRAGKVCPACGEVFTSAEELARHLKDRGVTANYTYIASQETKEEDNKPSPSDEGRTTPAAIYFTDPASCVVCRRSASSNLYARECIMIPCGHVYCCKSCGVRQAKCLLCENDCTDILHIAHTQRR